MHATHGAQKKRPLQFAPREGTQTYHFRTSTAPMYLYTPLTPFCGNAEPSSPSSHKRNQAKRINCPLLNNKRDVFQQLCKASKCPNASRLVEDCVGQMGDFFLDRAFKYNPEFSRGGYTKENYDQDKEAFTSRLCPDGNVKLQETTVATEPNIHVEKTIVEPERHRHPDLLTPQSIPGSPLPQKCGNTNRGRQRGRPETFTPLNTVQKGRPETLTPLDVLHGTSSPLEHALRMLKTWLRYFKRGMAPRRAVYWEKGAPASAGRSKYIFKEGLARKRAKSFRNATVFDA